MAETQTFAYGTASSLSRSLSCKNDTLHHDRLDLKLEVKAGSEPGTFEGYGAIFGNRDNDNDIVVKGAFVDSLKERTPAMLWQHNTKEPIGRFLDVREDDKGLYVRGKLSMKGKGAEAYELLSMGAMDGLSIGFVTKEATRDAASGTRTIQKADLMEISLVTFPANEMARIDSVKAASAISDERSFERFLRASGFSRSRAKTITAKGFKTDTYSHKKGHMMPYDEQEIAAIVDGLEYKKDRLLYRSDNFIERKKSFAKGPHLALIEETIGNFLSAYRAIRPTPQPMRLLRGETKKFHLGINLRQSSRGVKIKYDGTGIHLFECKINYWKWASTGPEREEIYLFQRKGSARLTNRFSQGSITGDQLRKWLGQIESLRQLESAVSRIENALKTLAPHGTLTYKGPHLKDPVPDMRHRNQIFNITG